MAILYRVCNCCPRKGNLMILVNNNVIERFNGNDSDMINSVINFDYDIDNNMLLTTTLICFICYLVSCSNGDGYHGNTTTSVIYTSALPTAMSQKWQKWFYYNLSLTWYHAYHTTGFFLYHEHYVVQREITEPCFHRTIHIDIILRALHL